MASPSRMPASLSDAQCQAVRHAASKHAASQNLAHPDKAATRGKPPRPASQGAAPPRLLRLPPLSQATATPRIHSHPERNRLLQTDSTPTETSRTLSQVHLCTCTTLPDLPTPESSLRHDPSDRGQSSNKTTPCFLAFLVYVLKKCVFLSLLAEL